MLRHSRLGGMEMYLAQARVPGNIQTPFREAWDRAEGHCGQYPQTRSQALEHYDGTVVTFS